MNANVLKLWVDDLLARVAGVAGTTWPRVFAGLVGLAIVLLAVVRCWERKWRVGPTLLVLFPGLFLSAIALDTRILHLFAGADVLDRVRVLLAGLSLLVFAVTFESIRISRLHERYALLWLATSALVLLVTLLPMTVELLLRFAGMSLPSAIVAILLAFLLLVGFHFSIALSDLEDDRSRIAQRCARLEYRILELERRLAPELVPVTDPPPLPPPPVSAQGAQRPRGIPGADAAALAVVLLSLLSVGWAVGTSWNTFYWIQLLVALFLWGRARRGPGSFSPVLLVVLVSTLPLNLRAVAGTGGEIVLAAQAVSAFALVDRRRYFLGSVFMALGCWFGKGGAVLLAALIGLLLYRLVEDARRVRRTTERAAGRRDRISGIASLLVLSASTLFCHPNVVPSSLYSPYTANAFRYGGGVLWLAFLTGLLGLLRPRGPLVEASASRHQAWPFGVGLLHFVAAALLTGGELSPGGVVPSLPFLLLPISEWTLRLPKPRWFLMTFVFLGLVQATWTVRVLRAEVDPVQHLQPQ